jgi:hypothetical protein
MRLSVPASLIGSLGSLAQQLLGGVNALVTTERGFAYGASAKSSAALASGATEQIFAAASNVNGAIAWSINNVTQGNGAGAATLLSLHAHTGAPAVFTDGDLILLNYSSTATIAGEIGKVAQLNNAVFIPAGKGLWWRNNGATGEGGSSSRCILYTLL